MNQRTYNVFDHLPDFDALCILTNGMVNKFGFNPMGKGIAKEAADRWVWLPQAVGECIEANGNHVYWQGVHSYSTSEQETQGIIGLFSFPTKNHWKAPSDLGLIRQSVRDLIEHVNRLGLQRVCLPYPGIGMGGLTPEVVWPEIESLDDRFTVVRL